MTTQKIIYLTENQLEELLYGKTITYTDPTTGETETLTYNENDMYAVPSPAPYVPVARIETITPSSSILSLSMEPDVCYIIDTPIDNFIVTITSNDGGNPLWEVKFKTSTSFYATFPPNTINWVTGTPQFNPNTEYTIFFENARETGKYDGYVVKAET